MNLVTEKKSLQRTGIGLRLCLQSYDNYAVTVFIRNELIDYIV